MASIFSKIIDGTIPAYKVAENDRFLAFLDINPLAKGHTLVIPKIEVDYIFDLDDDTYQALFAFAKKIASAIDKVSTSKRIGVSVIGLEVPHTHIHLVPINSIADLDFTKDRVKITAEEFGQIAASINAEL